MAEYGIAVETLKTVDVMHMAFHTTVPLVLTIILRNPTHGSVSDELHWIGDVTDNLQNYNKYFFCFINLIINNGNISCHHCSSCCHCNLKWCIIEVHPCMERQVHTTMYTSGKFHQRQIKSSFAEENSHKSFTPVLLNKAWSNALVLQAPHSHCYVRVKVGPSLPSLLPLLSSTGIRYWSLSIKALKVT